MHTSTFVYFVVLTSKPVSLEVAEAAADLNTTEESDVERKKIKKSIQKVKCPSLYQVLQLECHHHPIPQDMTT